MRVHGILETALYVSDLDRSLGFYQDLFGFPKLSGDDRFRALEVPGRQVLLLFRQGATREPIPLPNGGVIPPHDGTGELHLAFSIGGDEVAAWRGLLEQHGIVLEHEVAWPRGGTSLYFRDPDRHLVELATPGLWWPG